MDFLEELKDTAIDLAQSGVNKSRQLAEIARLNLANTAEESAIRKAYQEIGRLYYAERGMAPEAAYAALCEKITASKQKIEENKAKIAEMRAAGNINEDVYVAPNCDCGCDVDPEPEEPAPEQPPVVEPLADDKTKE